MRCYILLSLLFISCLSVNGQPKKQSTTNVPARLGYVSDYEKIFKDKDKAVLESTLAKMSADKKLNVQISVVTLGPATVGRQNFDTVLYKIANTWGVGQKNKNTGVMIAISVHYKVMRIFTGTGMGNRLPDAQIKEIINKRVLPYFRKQDYYNGALTAANAISDYLQK